KRRAPLDIRGAFMFAHAQHEFATPAKDPFGRIATPGKTCYGGHAGVVPCALLGLGECLLLRPGPNQHDVLPNGIARLLLFLQLDVKQKVGSIPGHRPPRLFLRLRWRRYFCAAIIFCCCFTSFAFLALLSMRVRITSTDKPFCIASLLTARVISFSPFSCDRVMAGASFPPCHARGYPPISAGGISFISP